VGVKMLLSEVVEVSTGLSLAVVGAILAVTTIASILLPAADRPEG